MKLIIHEIDKQRFFFNWLPHRNFLSGKHYKKIYIQSEFNFSYKQNLYHDKQNEMDELFDEYHRPLLKDIYHPSLIQ